MGEHDWRAGGSGAGWILSQRASIRLGDIGAAVEISAAAIKNKAVIKVYIDLNVGQNRTGIAPGNEALQLYVDCNLLPGIKPVGLHAYDGHIHDADLNARTEKCDAGFDLVHKLQADLMHKGYHLLDKCI